MQAIFDFSTTDGNDAHGSLGGIDIVQVIVREQDVIVNIFENVKLAQVAQPILRVCNRKVGTFPTIAPGCFTIKQAREDQPAVVFRLHTCEFKDQGAVIVDFRGDTTTPFFRFIELEIILHHDNWL